MLRRFLAVRRYHRQPPLFPQLLYPQFLSTASLVTPPATTKLSVPSSPIVLSHQLEQLQDCLQRHQDDDHAMELVTSIQEAHAALERFDPQFSNIWILTSGNETTVTEATDETTNTTTHNTTSSINEELARTLIQSYAQTSSYPQRAQTLLQQLTTPTMDDSNHVLHAWATSREHLRGTMAQRIFETIQTPNATSYRTIIQAWTDSGERRHAFTATGHLMKYLRAVQQFDLEPPRRIDYERVLRAWTRAEDVQSPGKAWSVIQLWKQAHTEGWTELQPDATSMAYVLQTARRRPLLHDLGNTIVQPIWKDLTRMYLIPNDDCYAAAIAVWKNDALHPETIHSEDAVRNAWEFLQEFVGAQNRQSVIQMQGPSITTWNDVLQALRVSRHYRRREQADFILQQVEAQGIVTADTYRYYLELLATERNAVDAGRAIVTRLVQSHQNSALASAANVVEAYNAFMDLCAKNTTSDNDQTIRICLQAVQELRNVFDGTPNALTYAGLLRLCQPTTLDRWSIVQAIFQACKNDGMVDEPVLLELRKVTSLAEYNKLVVQFGQDNEGLLVVPEEWTIHALGRRRVCTQDGRRAPPLTVHGRVHVSRAMQDFRLRKIRDGRNRNLLRGGRLTKEERYR